MGSTLQIQDDVVDWLPEDSKHVLLALGDGTDGWPAIYKLDTTTGQRSPVHGAKHGVRDLPDLIFQQAQYIGGAAAVEAQIGDVWGDRERLRATSPALQAARIEVPVLLVHGTQDRSVPVSQRKNMASALTSAGKKLRYVEQDGGDHFLSRDSHRLAFFKLLEAFLAEHTGPLA